MHIEGEGAGIRVSTTNELQGFMQAQPLWQRVRRSDNIGFTLSLDFVQSQQKIRVV